MNPVQYQLVQKKFLELRELDEQLQTVAVDQLRETDPEAGDLLRSLLQADTSDKSFLTNDRIIPPIQNLQPSEFSNETVTQAYQEVSAEHNEAPKRIGPYRILQKIGEGGHGVVYMAEQTVPFQRRVAIKCIKPGLESKMILARFEAERQALAIMSHPSIANVIDAGATETGQPFFVLELVHGIPIDQFCEENNLALGERLRLFQQVCEAVHHAHQKGIIHRDIKPANVLITLESGKPLAKVIDFGIAKALHMPLTEKTMFTEYGQIIGTLEYMSPEQATMSQTGADVRSDVYSLGALLYLLLTGETPIGKEVLLKDGLWELRNVLREFQPATPSLRVSSTSHARKWREHSATQDSLEPGQLRGDLDWITMKALAKEPERRYDSPSALAADIDHYLLGDAVSARPPSLLYSARKWVRKHQVITLVAATLLTSTAIAIIGLAGGYWRSLENLSTAKQATQLADDRAILLQESLNETEAERQRADKNATRLGGLLKRSLLETAWAQSLNGDAERAGKTLADIPAFERGFVWSFVDRVRRQMNAPAVRDELAGSVRKIAVHAETGTLAVITTQSNLEIWDTTNQTKTFEIELGGGIYTAAEFSCDGGMLLVGEGDSLHLVDLVTRVVVSENELGRGGIRDVVHHDDSKSWFVSTGADYVLQLNDLDLSTRTASKLTERLGELAVSVDGQWLAIAGSESHCFVMPTNNLNAQHIISGPPGHIATIRWNESELMAATMDARRMSITIEAITTAIENEARQENSKLDFELLPSQRLVHNRLADVELDLQGNLYLANKAGDVSVALLSNDRSIPIRSFDAAVTKIEFLRSGDLLVLQFNGRINVVRHSDIQQMAANSKGLDRLTDGVCLIESNVTVAAYDTGTLKRWNTLNGELENEISLHQGEILSLSVSEGRNRVASVGSDWKLKISQLDSLSTLESAPVGLGVRPVMFSSDGMLLAAAPDASNTDGLREGTLDLWQVTPLKSIRRLAGHTNWIMGIDFFADDSRLATLSFDGTVRIWDVELGASLITINLNEYATTTGFLVIESKNQILVGHSDGSISRWDLETGAPQGNKQLFASAIVDLAVPTDESCIAVSIESRPEIIFLTSDSLETIAKLDAGIGNIVALRTDAARSRIQVLSDLGSVRIWPFGNPETVNGR